MAKPDPRFWPLAWFAGNELTGVKPASDVVKAILAQWICEGGWAYPPARNNPGNNALGWAQATGYPFTVETPNPQPSDPIVTYPDLPTGVLAYADGFRVIRNSDGSLKYAVALAAANAGDGRGFVAAALDQGYGTSMSCFDSVYPYLPTPPAEIKMDLYSTPGRTTASLPAGTPFYDAPFGRQIGTISSSSTRFDIVMADKASAPDFVLLDGASADPVRYPTGVKCAWARASLLTDVQTLTVASQADIDAAKASAAKAAALTVANAADTAAAGF